MNEELDEIEKNNTWELIPRPKHKNIIGTKWVFKKKLDEEGRVVRNKARLVCKWYTQVEVIDFDENFSHVARLDAIRMFLAFACYKKIRVYEMDVKSTFLNGDLEEEVYIEHPKGFLLGDDENLVSRLEKDLYGFKWAPRAWYAKLDKYLQQEDFKKGSMDNNLYINFEGNHFLIIDVYVDDIIFGSDLEEMGQNFVQGMLK